MSKDATIMAYSVIGGRERDRTLTPREAGFYWVKMKRSGEELEWEVAVRSSWGWGICDSDETFYDSDFAIIGERIIPPQ